MAQHRITYTGDGVVRLEGVGNFMSGTSAFVEEAQARAAKRIPGFVVEGLSDDYAPEPVRASKSRDERRVHLVEVPPEPEPLKAPELPKAPEPPAPVELVAKVSADS